MEPTIASQDAMRVIDRMNQCIRLLLKEGLPFEAIQMPIDNPDMRKRLIRFWACGGYELTMSQKRAREIMGHNMFGVEEAIKHFGVNTSRQQLAALSDIPFTEATLEM